jgi:aromatic ring-opening dioxygenase LigB subunit
VAGREIAPAVTAAARGVRVEDAGAIVIASPHGSATGVYAAASGDLDAFGPRGIGVAPPGDASFARRLGEAWGRPVLDEPADHGVVVPLRLLQTRDVPVVAVTFEEGLDVAAAVDVAEAFVAALSRLDGAVAFVASANTSAGLTERAPLPSLPGAAEADRALLDALRTDPRLVTRCLPALAAAGSCGTGPLAALSFVLGSSPCDVVAYEHPAGVGYAVAVS